jgi:hypothetical protein
MQCYMALCSAMCVMKSCVMWFMQYLTPGIELASHVNLRIKRGSQKSKQKHTKGSIVHYRAKHCITITKHTRMSLLRSSGITGSGFNLTK